MISELDYDINFLRGGHLSALTAKCGSNIL